MTKNTMIWQMLNGIIAGMARRKDIPETAELFEKQVLDEAQTVLDFTRDEIKHVLYNYDCTAFAEVMAHITKFINTPVNNVSDGSI